MSFPEDLMDFSLPWNIKEWFVSLNQISDFCSIIRFISDSKIQDYLVMENYQMMKNE